MLAVFAHQVTVELGCCFVALDAAAVGALGMACRVGCCGAAHTILRPATACAAVGTDARSGRPAGNTPGDMARVYAKPTRVCRRLPGGCPESFAVLRCWRRLPVHAAPAPPITSTPKPRQSSAANDSLRATRRDNNIDMDWPAIGAYVALFEPGRMYGPRIDDGLHVRWGVIDVRVVSLYEAVVYAPV